MFDQTQTQVAVEFDETHQQCKMRNSVLGQVDGAFPTLLIRAEALLIKGARVMLQPIVVAPAILRRCTPSCMWDAINRRLPIPLFSWSRCAEAGCFNLYQ